jgi:hypothetical protein
MSVAGSKTGDPAQSCEVWPWVAERRLKRNQRRMAPVKPAWIVGFAARAARDRRRAKNRKGEITDTGLTIGRHVTGSNAEAGSSQGMAALDSAVRPEDAEGKKTSREADRVQPDVCFATGKGAADRYNCLGRRRWINNALKRKTRVSRPVEWIHEEFCSTADDGTD